MTIKDQYSELLKMTSPCEKLIRRDIARTYPEHDFFKEKDSFGQEVLFNVMKVSYQPNVLMDNKKVYFLHINIIVIFICFWILDTGGEEKAMPI